MKKTKGGAVHSSPFALALIPSLGYPCDVPSLGGGAVYMFVLAGACVETVSILGQHTPVIDRVAAVRAIGIHGAGR